MSSVQQESVSSSPEQFDLDKFSEALGKNLNGLAGNLRTLTLKYISYSISSSELAKEQDEKDKESVGKLVQKLLRVRKFLEETASEVDSMNSRVSSFES